MSSFTSMLNDFLAAKTTRSYGCPAYQTMPPSEANASGPVEQRTFGSSFPGDISLTSTSSASLPAALTPKVLNFSRVIDFFYANEYDHRETKKPNVEVDWRYQSSGSSASAERSTAVQSESTATKIEIIDWHMLDKWKFYPLSMLSSFTIRCCLYPFTVVKTCIQVISLAVY